jgi:hypothetical protein
MSDDSKRNKVQHATRQSVEEPQQPAVTEAVIDEWMVCVNAR